MPFRGVMRAGDRGQIYFIRTLTLHNCTAAYCSGEVCSGDSGVPCVPPPCIITPRPKARVKYAPVEGGPSACRNGFMQAWSRFICDLSSARRAEELEVDVEPRRVEST